MIKNRILWLLWLVGMAGATVMTGTWLFAAVLLLTVLILIFSAGSVALSGKKAVIKLHLPKASERMECFHGNVFGKSVCMAGIWRSRSAQMENLFTGEKGVIPLSFPWEQRKNRSSGLRPGSSWCGCIRFCFSDWKCQRFFHVFYVKRKADTGAYTVIMPERQKGSFPFLQGKDLTWKASVIQETVWEMTREKPMTSGNIAGNKYPADSLEVVR